MNATLRSATAADRPFVESVYFETQRWIIEKLFGWRGDDVERAKFDEFCSETDTKIVSVAGEDVGWMSVRTSASGSMDLDALYLLPIAQKKGIGNALVRQVIQRAVSDNATLTVSTAKINPARRLYERLGFVTTHESEFKVFMVYGGHVKPHSAIILPVPEIEPFVSTVRSQHDPSAKHGVPAHITLLYPFLDPPQAINAGTALKALFADFEPFEFEFKSIDRFEHSVHLRPTREERFVEMTERIVERWPSHPPYGGVHADIVPHLTIAESTDSATLDAVRNTDFGLPIKAMARAAYLMTNERDGIWRVVERLPLLGRDLKRREGARASGR